MTKVKGKPAKKDKLNNEKAIVEVISVQDISDYIANTIADLKNHSKLSFAFGIHFDEVILNTVDTDIKAIVILLIDEIESGDEYNWTVTTAPNLLAHYYTIGFITSLLSASHYTKVHCDATYRTAKGRFELYRIVDNIEGTD
ncbi:2244_t:CDS:2 [Racocetra fulgida]|uniref:2244_t:CDS:1 n=1 Tax=Racocetra fulgida TaxID=60492 RepID=A0A9N9F627_9GLOM|nr:2244_t:CDS:2 [Racocetra fulgida]